MRGLRVASVLLMSATLLAQEPPAAGTGRPAGPTKTTEVALPEPTRHVPLLGAALEGPMAGVEEIVFAVRVWAGDHWYSNFGHSAKSPGKRYFGDGGRLCRLNLRTKKVTVLLDDPEGGVRDPQVHYDAKKILFSYRRGGTRHYHLYEIDADGSNLRRLTDGPFDDIEPTYLPGGAIIFISSRCNRYVQCWDTQVATLYRSNGDGGEIRPLSANMEHDNTPWMLPDGRVIYQRWEYVDRNFGAYHHLWTMNPDGTGQMVYYGNMLHGKVMIDAKPIPGTDKVVASFNPGHGQFEHAGEIVIVDPKAGPDDPKRATRISPAQPYYDGQPPLAMRDAFLRHWLKSPAKYRDPYPFSEDCFLVCVERRILLMNARGELDLVYELPRETAASAPAHHAVGSELWVHEPVPLVPRPREPLVPDRVDLRQETGRVFLADVRHGRNMAGIRPGEIKKLLVLETLPKPINFGFTNVPISHKGTYTLERVLGTVPVEPDGSAYAEVPALRSLFFVALDERGTSVKRMQSFLTVQPGETFSCAGCHEHRTDAPRPRPQGAALARGPARIEPIADVPDVFDFPRDIQPILGRHCVACHNAAKPEGNVALDQPYPAYALLMDPKRTLIAHGQDRYGNRPPRSIGTSASRLMQLIDGSHEKAKVSDLEKKTIALWIETGAPYAGTYGSLGMHFQPSYAAADGFRPTAHYVREMKRYGILPESFDLGKEPIDCYAVDRAYWRSFWHRGASAPAGAGQTALHVPGERSAH